MVDTRGLENSDSADLGSTSRCAGGDDATFEVLNRLDATVVTRDHVVVVIVENRERPDGHGAEFCERAPPRVRVVQRVGQGKADIRRPVGNELQVIDRARRHLGRGFDIDQAVADHLGHTSTIGVVDAARPARGN